MSTLQDLWEFWWIDKSFWNFWDAFQRRLWCWLLRKQTIFV